MATNEQLKAIEILLFNGWQNPMTDGATIFLDGGCQIAAVFSDGRVMVGGMHANASNALFPPDVKPVTRPLVQLGRGVAAVVEHGTGRSSFVDVDDNGHPTSVPMR